MRRYGNEMVLVGATYKTTRYALPLFFMVVKTNVDYHIVVSFVAENETQEAITEVLEVIKSWNPQFSPKFGMTDYCNEEIKSLESTFPVITFFFISCTIVLFIMVGQHSYFID